MAHNSREQSNHNPRKQLCGKNHRDAINGMLLIDKPAGLSSNQALQKAKRLLNAKKAGHTGSLDPIATGVLPLCFGHATKISEMFLSSDKSYEVQIQLGVETDSGDREGNIIGTSNVDVSYAQIKSVLNRFKCLKEQVPPMFSALKRNGQPLYKLARQGIEVEREPRSVIVHELSMIKFRADVLELRVHCSKGFYIRSLAMDIGKKLGCGAHVLELKRIGAGPFSIEQTITLDQLEALESPEVRQTLLLSTDHALGHLPKINLSDSLTKYFCHGQTIRVLEMPAEGLTRLYSEDDKFLGLGEATPEGTVKPKRIFV